MLNHEKITRQCKSTLTLGETRWNSDVSIWEVMFSIYVTT